MKILSSVSQNVSSPSAPSDQEIRDKVKNNKKAKLEKSKPSEPAFKSSIPETFEELNLRKAQVKKVPPKPEVDNEEIMFKPDVSLNDPNDPTTIEKLKSVLGAGGINFSAKERSVLEKILAKN